MQDNLNDVTENNLQNKLQEEKKVNKKKTIPVSQYDLLNIAQSVLKKWKETPFITLQWIKIEEYEQLVNDLADFLQKRTDAGSKRPMHTRALQDLDKQINQAVEQVKIYLINQYGKEGVKPYYAEFGIIRKNTNGYILPKDRNQRLNALSLFTKACLNYKLETISFKKDFFEKIYQQYERAISQSQVLDSTVTSNVGSKNDSMQMVKEVLQALIMLIKANYPKTYTNELRAWGFQKEKY